MPAKRTRWVPKKCGHCCAIWKKKHKTIAIVIKYMYIFYCVYYKISGSTAHFDSQSTYSWMVIYMQHCVPCVCGCPSSVVHCAAHDDRLTRPSAVGCEGVDDKKLAFCQNHRLTEKKRERHKHTRPEWISLRFYCSNMRCSRIPS